MSFEQFKSILTSSERVRDYAGTVHYCGHRWSLSRSPNTVLLHLENCDVRCEWVENGHIWVLYISSGEILLLVDADHPRCFVDALSAAVRRATEDVRLLSLAVSAATDDAHREERQAQQSELDLAAQVEDELDNILADMELP